MLRGGGVLAVLVAIGAVVGANAPRAITAADAPPYTGAALLSQLQLALDTTVGELEITRLELDRARALVRYSAAYQIPADLAGLIYDSALREGIDPDLAFQLVHVESRFNPRARSHAGAIGLAQVQLPTARFYDASITEERLLDAETNLRIGLRYLRDLLEVYGTMDIALLAYNRGPTRVNQLLEEGRDPRNGFAGRVLSVYGDGR
jgi:soluble lytic murein transglycosylase-like protein